MRNRRSMLLMSLMLGAALLSSAQAQVPAVPAPYNVELGAVITNAARAAGTVTTAQLENLAYDGVLCTFNQTALGGSPSTTFSIQQFDSASSSYFTLVTSGAITANDTPTPLMVYPGIQTATLPSGMVAIGVKLTRKWRVSQTVAGTATPTSTGTIGCTLLK